VVAKKDTNFKGFACFGTLGVFSNEAALDRTSRARAYKDPIGYLISGTLRALPPIWSRPRDLGSGPRDPRDQRSPPYTPPSLLAPEDEGTERGHRGNARGVACTACAASVAHKTTREEGEQTSNRETTSSATPLTQ